MIIIIYIYMIHIYIYIMIDIDIWLLNSNYYYVSYLYIIICIVIIHSLSFRSPSCRATQDSAPIGLHHCCDSRRPPHCSRSRRRDAPAVPRRAGNGWNFGEKIGHVHRFVVLIYTYVYIYKFGWHFGTLDILKFGHDSKIGHVVDDSSRKTGGNMVKKWCT